MKHNLLLLPLCASITLIGMQRPISLSEQFMAATERGDIQLVVNMLNQNPSLLNDIRNYYNYATEPILKFAKRNPGKTAEYMQIARFLVNNGARIHPSALKELETFEQSYRAPAPTYTQPRPTYQQPIPAPAPVQPRPQPYMPAVAPSQPAPVPQPLSKATEEKYQNLLKAIGETNPNEVKKILSQIDPKELSSSQQQELFSKADTIFLYIFNYAQLSVAKEIIKLLLAKGWAPSPSIKQRIDLYLQNQGLGNRSAWIKPPLTEAIMKFNVAEVRRLITQERADVNEPDSLGSSPLDYAIANPNKEILELLLKNGARIKNDGQRAQLSQILGRPI